MMFAHERKFWHGIRRFDRSLSVVTMTPEMVESENSGQVFMASRFIISPKNDFRHAREFAPTIGTDLYAPSDHRGKLPSEAFFSSGADVEQAHEMPDRIDED
jgi:hypothetical protein